MHLTSSDFDHEQLIPSQFTCEGENISPALSWTDVPPKTKSLTLVLHDPDAPRQGGFTHWILYNIPPNVHAIAQDLPRRDKIEGIGMQGENDGGEIGYTGPCPPMGTHRFFLRLFALDRELKLLPGASYKEVNDAMARHVLATAELMGKYTRRSKRAA